MDPKQYAYPVDGLIFEQEDMEYGASLGATRPSRAQANRLQVGERTL